MKVLMIGNSFCYYYADELYKMAQSAGVDLKVYNIYKSGCSLEEHWNAYLTNNLVGDPLFRHNGKTIASDGKWVDYLMSEDWDVISIMASGRTDYESVEEYFKTEFGEDACHLKNIYHLLKEKFPKARMLYHHTWIYGCNPEGIQKGLHYFPKNEQERKQWYQIQKEAVETYIVKGEYEFDVVPSGEAWRIFEEDYGVHNTKLCGSSTNGIEGPDKPIYGDYYHDGDIGGGQYLNACVWFEVLTGTSCIGDTTDIGYSLNDYGLSVETREALQRSAHKAVREAGYKVNDREYT